MKNGKIKQIMRSGAALMLAVMLAAQGPAAVFAEEPDYETESAEEEAFDASDDYYEEDAAEGEFEDDYAEDDGCSDDEDAGYEDAESAFDDEDEEVPDDVTADPDDEEDELRDADEGAVESAAESLTEFSSAQEAFSTAEEPMAAGSVADSGVYDETINWTLYEDGTLIISGRGEIDAYPWRYSSTDVTSVQITEGITGIGDRVFENNNKLTTVKIAGSVSTIDYGAFQCCDALTTVTLSGGLKSIGGCAFQSCTSLTEVFIPASVTRIGYMAFYDCTALETVNIAGKVSVIEDKTFAGCTQLTDIVLPSSLTSIAEKAFYECENLTGISIPTNVTSIGNSAFDGCSSLTSVVIPDSVTNMGMSSFQYCSGLKSVTISKSLTKIVEGSFSQCWSLQKVTIPEGVVDIEEYAFYNCNSMTSVTIPDGVRTIGEHSFDGCSSLKSLTLPDSVKTIEESAFSYCSDLTKVTFPENEQLISIKSSLFEGCKSLQTFTIPNTIEGIGSSAFEHCENLKSIVIPGSVVNIGESAFRSCVNLADVTIRNGTEVIDDYAFYYCGSLLRVDIPASVRCIGKQAFACHFWDSALRAVFRGSSGALSEDTFSDSLVCAYYPQNNTSWTEDSWKNYGGSVTWHPYGSLKNAVITGISDKTYTGAALTQKPVVKFGQDTLVLNRDYYLAYKDNVNAGRATIAIKGMDPYSNVAVRYFNVKPVSVANATITNIVSKVYTGSALTQTPVVKLGGKTLKLDTDYYLAYKNNINTGRATIAIKGKGNYNGVAVRYFAVNPKPSWIDSLSSPKTKQITIKWGKRGQISGYQLEISTNKDFSKPKMQKNVYDPAKLSMTVTVEKAKMTYYVRIRSFKKTSNKTYFSTWSATKTVKTK